MTKWSLACVYEHPPGPLVCETGFRAPGFPSTQASFLLSSQNRLLFSPCDFGLGEFGTSCHHVGRTQRAILFRVRFRRVSAAQRWPCSCSLCKGFLCHTLAAGHHGSGQSWDQRCARGLGAEAGGRRNSSPMGRGAPAVRADTGGPAVRAGLCGEACHNCGRFRILVPSAGGTAILPFPL